MTKVNKPFNIKKIKEAAKKLNAIESNKPKLFEDYREEKIRHEVPLLNALHGLVNMVDDLAIKQAELNKDNDLLRGQITELTHKMDFVMENSKKAGGIYSENGVKCFNPEKTFKELYKDSLKKKKKNSQENA